VSTFAIFVDQIEQVLAAAIFCRLYPDILDLACNLVVVISGLQSFPKFTVLPFGFEAVTLPWERISAALFVSGSDIQSLLHNSCILKNAPGHPQTITSGGTRHNPNDTFA
jgi:hypothetical protein